MQLSGAVSVALEPRAVKAALVRAEPDPLARWFLAAALALGCLRFVGLARWSLWLDEALTLADAPRGGSGLNPLGYWLFDWVYGLVPGRPDEFWLRFPAALLGLASIAATAWALRPFFGARASALAAFFLSVSVWHLYWSQNARFYTLAQTLAVLGGGVLLRGIYLPSTARTAWGLVLLAAAALTHPSSVFVLAPLLAAPWLAFWFEWLPADSTRARSWNLFSAAGLVALVLGSGWALKTWLRWEARQGIGNPLHLVQTAGYLISPALGLAFLWGAWRHRLRRESFVPVVATVLGLAAAGAASLFARVSAQYVFVLQPWLAACAGLAFLPREGEEEGAPARRRRTLLALLVALPGLVESALYFTLRNGDRPPWREAYAYVFEHRGPGDLVLGMDAPVAEYYLNPGSEELRDWTAVTWFDDYRAHLAQEWARYGRRTWFVVNRTLFDDWRGLPSSDENRAEVERILREECVLAASFEVPLTPRDLDVLVYVTRP